MSGGHYGGCASVRGAGGDPCDCAEQVYRARAHAHGCRAISTRVLTDCDCRPAAPAVDDGAHGPDCRSRGVPPGACDCAASSGARDIEALARKYAEQIEDAVGGPVDHPKHYNTNPSGVECITVVEHMSFNVGNAVKYLWRADQKGAPLEDLKKARWYIEREIERRRKEREVKT